jgi:hypothetical protein
VLGGVLGSAAVDWVLVGLLGFGCLIAWEFFHVSERLRKLGKRQDPDARVLEIILDENDQRCVRDHPDLYGGIRSRHWWVGLKNVSVAKSIDDVSLRAQQNQFVDSTVRVAHDLRDGSMPRNPIVLKIDTLSPNAEELVDLFGLGGSDVYSEGDILAKKNRFVLEARGRDTQRVLVVLEYDPSTRPPVIRRVS